ncbi:hypothetical protein CYMTET_45689 [Cymbomonas tetramitiformis]|uniref:Uncharacterized protein n=1 Tax=Cymbomonas tetramitiformis TaxID=36881 RepID=A0AAE0BYX1_9CHLO|nr:hypothetical protein CYMTET_45689 [Cymbomonas tetramitiformis]
MNRVDRYKLHASVHKDKCATVPTWPASKQQRNFFPRQRQNGSRIAEDSRLYAASYSSRLTWTSHNNFVNVKASSSFRRTWCRQQCPEPPTPSQAWSCRLFQETGRI